MSSGTQKVDGQTLTREAGTHLDQSSGPMGADGGYEIKDQAPSLLGGQYHAVATLKDGAADGYQKSAHFNYPVRNFLTRMMAFINRPSVGPAVSAFDKASRKNDRARMDKTITGFTSPVKKVQDAVIALMIFRRMLKNGMPMMSARDTREFQWLSKEWESKNLPAGLRRAPNRYASLKAMMQPAPSSKRAKRVDIFITGPNAEAVDELTGLKPPTSPDEAPKPLDVTSFRETTAQELQKKKERRRKRQTNEYVALNALLAASLMAPEPNAPKPRKGLEHGVADDYHYRRKANFPSPTFG